MSKLGLEAILQGMADALPAHPKGEDSSDLTSSYEAVALVVHSYLTALRFKFVGFNEEKPLENPAATLPRLPSQWNNGFGSYGFVYRHKQSLMTFVIRIDRISSKVEVRGLAVGDENIYRFDRPIRDIIQSGALPLKITLKEDGEEDRSDLVQKLRGLFVSESVFLDFIRDLKVNIIQRLIPKLQNEDYVEEYEAEANARSERRAREIQDPRNPLYGNMPPTTLPNRGPRPLPEMARPRPTPVGDFPPPDFEDEHRMQRPRPDLVMPGRSPYNIGHDDLNPPGLGPHDPLRGPYAGGGFRPPLGGMYPTFDDLQVMQGGSGYGQQGYDPEIPPGARWSPTGPGGNPRFPGPGTGRGLHPFGGSDGFGGGYGGGPII